MHYNDGVIKEGNWINDKSEGKGIIYFKNGARYEGFFYK